MRKKEPKKEYENEVLDISRVERMTSGGRRLRFRTMIVLGDKKGKVGVAAAKGNDVQQAIEKATRKAEKEMVTVPISSTGTIPHEVKAKHGAAVVLLKPQTEGRGLVAGGTVRTICHLAGVENVSGKILGNTRNKLNNARATIKALTMLKMSEKDVVKEKEVVKESVKNEVVVEKSVKNSKSIKKNADSRSKAKK